MRGDLLLPELGLALDAVGPAMDVERPALEIGEQDRRDRRVVDDEVTLRQAGPGEERLVEVGEVDRVPAHVPAAALAERPKRLELGPGDRRRGRGWVWIDPDERHRPALRRQPGPIRPSRAATTLAGRRTAAAPLRGLGGADPGRFR